MVGNPERGGGLRELGADDVVVGLEAVGEPFDLILESAGGPSLAAALTRVSPDGTVVSFGNSSNEPTTFDARGFYRRGRPTVRGYFVTHELLEGRLGSAELARLVELVSSARLRVEVGLVVPWADAASAVTALLERRVRGKAVITVGSRDRSHVDQGRARARRVDATLRRGRRARRRVIPRRGRRDGRVRGPERAGKTTAMRIALGVLQADAGRVSWRGRVVDAETRRRFGYLPEERGLYPKMRVLDQLVYLARLHGLEREDARSQADRMIELLGVAGRARDRAESLSLGNQQRVQLAAALVHRPEVLVLDEPFSGLDPVGVDVLSEVLRRQADDGAPVVFSSHQLELVERLCESVVMIDRGRIVASGRIADLRARDTRRLVRVEVAGAPDRWLDRVPGVRVIEPLAEGAIVELDGAGESDVLDAARAAGSVRHFSVVRPSLSEIFRREVTR